jgi:hypothetical protein
MMIENLIRSSLLEQMFSCFQIDKIEGEQILSAMEEENFYTDILTNEKEIDEFINGTLTDYLRPNSLSRRQIYDEQFLNKNGIVLRFIKIIPDGWDCALYFDEKNNLYWEDHYGRYTKEGYRISPYVRPLNIYK